jgi:hypothetical protein
MERTIMTNTRTVDLSAGQEFVETPHGVYRITPRIQDAGQYDISYVDADQFARAVLRATTVDLRIEQARRHLADGHPQSAVAALYDAETAAFKSQRYDEAMKMRKAVECLTSGRVPAWLAPVQDAEKQELE